MSDKRRFVVLHHQTPADSPQPTHWDLMIEDGEALATWALPAEPTSLNSGAIIASRLADHRKAYLTYEGPLSQGRGKVSQWDAGECQVVAKEDDAWRVNVQGAKLIGEMVLRRQADRHWEISFAGSASLGGN